jgi:hypothetical protein
VALICEGNTKCALCGKQILQGGDIIALPAISETDHILYKYFDEGFHLKCFEVWDKKSEIEYLLSQDQKHFKDSEYFKEMKSRYGNPKKTKNY